MVAQTTLDSPTKAMHIICPMTHRNNYSQTLQAMPIGMDEPLRVAFTLAPIAVFALVLLSLITVLTGAGFRYV
jgi:hypothetical protein